MHFKVAEPGKFKKAKIDLILYGTSKSMENPDYGGGFLLKDILKRKEIEVIIETDSKTIKTSLTLMRLKPLR